MSTPFSPPSSSSDWLSFSAITKEELLAAIRGSRVQVVNVLEERSKKMIATSRHIPMSELEQRLGELDRGRDVVVYCAGPTCPLSRNAARVLAGRGFHVRTYEGGLEEWSAAQFPLDEKKPTPPPPAPASATRVKSEEKQKEDEKKDKKEDEKKDEKTDEKTEKKDTTAEESSLMEKNPAAEPSDGSQDPGDKAAHDEKKGGETPPEEPPVRSGAV